MAVLTVLETTEEPANLVLGGGPIATPTEGWQRCAECGSRMEYLFGLPMSLLDPADTRLLLVTQCGADPGLCDEWEPYSGGNRAYLFSSDAEGGSSRGKKSRPRKLKGSPVSLATRPLELDDAELAAMLAASDEDDSDLPDQAPDDAANEESTSAGAFAGHIGTGPSWYQDDETPTCPCGTRMRFVLQLEEWAHPEFNFGGGGVGYAFICPQCPDSAAWLFQC